MEKRNGDNNKRNRGDEEGDERRKGKDEGRNGKRDGSTESSINRRKKSKRRRKKNREREEWMQEKGILEKRIEDLEWINEKKERKDRKNNIILKGMNWKAESLEQEVEEYIRDNIKIIIEVKKANKITMGVGRSMVIAELVSWEQKRSIMSRKKDLKKGNIIEDDLTRKERGIQMKLREMARKEREKRDDKVRVGYKKINKGGNWYRWNEKEERLVEERGSRRE